MTTEYDERDLYTGLAAEHWRAVSETDPRTDQEFYRRIIQRQGGTALELGCGAGRLLLAYLKEGLDVIGADISGDILEVCRQEGAAAGLEPRVYEQAMQDLDLPMMFKTIYIPCGSFVCVMDIDAAVDTLRRCRAHLEPGGVLVFNIHLADHDYSNGFAAPPISSEWQFKAEKQLAGGRRLVVSNRDTGVHPIDQVVQEERRYQLFQGDAFVREEVHAGQTRWYFRNEVLHMLQLAGFTRVTVTGDVTDEPYGPQHERMMMFTADRTD